MHRPMAATDKTYLVLLCHVIIVLQSCSRPTLEGGSLGGAAEARVHGAPVPCRGDQPAQFLQAAAQRLRGAQTPRSVWLG